MWRHASARPAVQHRSTSYYAIPLNNSGHNFYCCKHQLETAFSSLPILPDLTSLAPGTQAPAEVLCLCAPVCTRARLRLSSGRSQACTAGRRTRTRSYGNFLYVSGEGSRVRFSSIFEKWGYEGWGQGVRVRMRVNAVFFLSYALLRYKDRLQVCTDWNVRQLRKRFHW